MTKTLLFAACGIAFVLGANSAGAYDAVTSTTVREETTGVVPVVPAPTVSKKVTVQQSDASGNRTTTEETNTTAGLIVAPQKPVTTRKSSVVSQADEDGNYRRVETNQTLNGDGYMVREEYHEQRN